MSTLTFNDALLPLGGTDTRTAMDAPARPSFWARMGAAILESRRRQAERELDRLELIYGFKIRDTAFATERDAARDLPF